MSITSLRIPDGLLSRVKAEAERTHRSMNSELLWLIERGLNEERSGVPPIPLHD